jgi:CRP-like cAMP-binding protein
MAQMPRWDGADAAMGYPRFGMLDLLKLLGGLLVGLFRSHAAREAETAFLRQQLVVLKRSAPARLRLRTADRLIFVWLYRLFPSVREGAVVFKPETLVRWHLAYQSCFFPDGRQAIVDVFTPGNVVGLEAILSHRASGTVTATGPVKYLWVEVDSFYRLMENREIAVCFTSLLVEARRRSEELAARIARLEAPERIAAMLVDLYDRLRRRRLIARSTYNLHLTQRQIGDHLGLTGETVNRVLRWFAREDIAFVDRYVVIIRDMPRLRSWHVARKPIEARRTKPVSRRMIERIA